MTFTRRQKLGVLFGLFGITLIVGALLSPIAQDPDFHDFADKRMFLGIENFADVASNIGFLIVGLLAMFIAVGPRRKKIFDNNFDVLPYIAIFASFILVAIGSSFYHLNPNSDTLVWDRLPMTIGFMSIFAAVIADRIDPKSGIFILLPVLILIGITSVAWWAYSEAQGQGDLRAYAMVQFFPMIAIPLILYLFPKHRYTDTRSAIFSIGWYVIAKILEILDRPIFDFLGGTLSGHTLKHLAAAIATYYLLHMVIVAAKNMHVYNKPPLSYLRGL